VQVSGDVNGRCRMHGGMSPGASRGNKNALKTRTLHGRSHSTASRDFSAKRPKDNASDRNGSKLLCMGLFLGFRSIPTPQIVVMQALEARLRTPSHSTSAVPCRIPNAPDPEREAAEGAESQEESHDIGESSPHLQQWEGNGTNDHLVPGDDGCHVRSITGRRDGCAKEGYQNLPK
jgi:hypothetical protein